MTEYNRPLDISYASFLFIEGEIETHESSSAKIDGQAQHRIQSHKICWPYTNDSLVVTRSKRLRDEEVIQAGASFCILSLT